MIIVDVNLLLYAVVDGFPQHRRARAWWEETINGNVAVALPAPTLFGFLRLVTSRRVLESPLAMAEAIGLVGDWMDQPNVTFLPPGPRHVDIALGFLGEMGTARDLTTDVQLGALAIEYDATVYSHDTDFGRFREVRWIDPLR